jgi:hypothetical protein
MQNKNRKQMKMNILGVPRTTLTSPLAAGLAALGILLGGAKAQAQPVIANTYPDGKHLFESSSALSFNAQSSVGVASVSVALKVTTLTGVTYLLNLTSASGLTISGPATDESVSAPLSSNTLYSATIQVTDTANKTTIASVSFDTVSPSYVFEAEDWDYTSGAVTGLFIDNPQTNKYAGLASTSGVDYNNANPGSGNSNYRPQGMETEVAGDSPRLPYLGVGNTNVDYDVGFATGGGWANYTRHYPAGLYNVYARLADGNGNTTDAASMTVIASASGNGAFIGASPFTFSVKTTGWQNYAYYPLMDANNTLVQFTNDGTEATLQVHTDSGNYNANFYMFLPADTNASVASSVEFTNVYPDGLTQFQPSSNLTFTVISAVPISSGNVFVLLSGTNLLGQIANTLYTTANGLSVQGSDTNFNVSVPLASNTTYSAFIQTLDANDNPATLSLGFDTISPIYTWEAEDFDYSEGQYVDNPQTNAYYGTDGIFGFDCYSDPGSTNHGTPYRQPPGSGPETEGCGDIPRAAYTNTYPNNLNPLSGLPYQDYDCGFNDNNDWENYTRHYPSGTWNIYARGANGGGGSGSGGMELVTSGVGTSNQTVTNLGTFTYPSTGNWQSYVFTALKDSSGNLVSVTLGGSGPETLRTIAPSSGNMNFFMLMPADTTLPRITGLYPDGVGFFERTNAFSFTASSSLGIATSNIVVTVNGNNVAANLTFTGSADSWFVSYPLQNNNVYAITVSVTANGGASITTSTTFDTFSASYYTWESSDYDYTSNGVSGLYFDNPQIDKYNGLDAAPGIDEQEVTAGTPISEDLYRVDTNGDLLITTQPGSDLPRAQFGTNATWRINWFGFGDFANYTRHYPAGTYNVFARFTEGGGNSSATLWQVTNGVGTPTQSTKLLGMWTVPLVGWGAWTWEELTDTNGNPTTVTFDGSQTTLQLGSSLTADGQTINVGFFMLVPATPSGLTLTGSLSPGNISISFPTVTGKNYQVVYKNNLTDASWTTLGTPVAGNNAVQSVQYSTTGTPQRYYSVQIE